MKLIQISNYVLRSNVAKCGKCAKKFLWFKGGWAKPKTELCYFVLNFLWFLGSPNTVPGSTTSPPTECTISMDRWGVGLAAHLPQVAIFFVENHLKQQNHTRRRSPLYSWYHECYFYSKSRNRYQVLLQNCFLQSFLIKLAPVLILAAEITAMSRSPA